MEKHQDTPEDHKYTLEKDVKWRVSLDEGSLPFKKIIPAHTEFTSEALKKKELPEHSEGSILKTFKGKSSQVFNKGNLVFCSRDNKFYKVVDLKTDDDYKPTWVSLVSKDGIDKKEIDSEKQFAEFQNFVDINLVISAEGKEKDVIQVRLKIYDKFETGLESAFTGVGQPAFSFKLFMKGKALDKESSLAQLEDVKDGEFIYASQGFGKPFTWKRFPRVYTSYGWSNSGSYPDGITYVPTQNVKI